MNWELIFDIINALGIVLDMIGVIISFKFVSKAMYEGMAAYQASAAEFRKGQEERKMDGRLKTGLWFFLVGFFFQMVSAVADICCY